MRDGLITPEELAARLDDPALRIGDCRWYLGDAEGARRAYAEAHIPGAVHLDLERHLSAPFGPGRHPLPSRVVSAAILGALGFGDGTFAVVYDDRGGAIAARAWWMLSDAGHDRVRILDGGLQAWAEAGLPLTGEVVEHDPEFLTVQQGPSRQIDRETLAARLGEVTVLDVRAPERYRGEEEPIDPVAGHIPTALNAPCEENLGPDGRFLDPETLAGRYRGLGAGSGEVVVSCGSGVTACHTAFAMRLAGLPEPLLYPGSWSDWSREGMPVATGPEPGPVPDVPTKEVP